MVIGRVAQFYRNDGSKWDGLSRIQAKSVWRIPLHGNISLKDIKKSCRKQIKKAEQESVRIRLGNIDDLPSFYNVLKQTAKRSSFPLRSFQYFIDMWETLHNAGKLKLFLAEKENNAISAALVGLFGKGAWGFYGGTDDTARKNGASYLLHWEIIKWASQREFNFYDLGGIPLNGTNDKNISGIYLFKSNFGGDRVDFVGEFDCIQSPLKYAAWQIAMRSGQKMLKQCSVLLQKYN
jgi:peptidoglycan pentaglycine glycine transferase (the first glycine)